MPRVLELRTYALKPGSGPAFDGLAKTQSLPMLRRWHVDVVHAGPSLESADSYLLVRSYADLADRQASQEAFYGSEEWKKGSREAILSHILSYTTVVVPATEALISAFRAL